MKTEEKSASNKKLISLCVIERALEGDIQAINKVLKLNCPLCQGHFELV